MEMPGLASGSMRLKMDEHQFMISNAPVRPSRTTSRHLFSDLNIFS